MSKVQVARRADFLYGKMEERNVQSVVGWASGFSIWKNGEGKYPKCRWLGGQIFYMRKRKNKISQNKRGIFYIQE